MPRLYAPACLLVIAAAVGACAKEVPVVEVKGECADAFQGQVCTWARMQGETVVAVGADVALASIENAPKDEMPAWPPVPAAVLRLPDAAQKGTGITQVTMYWEAMGHPPGPYMVPHFDFHFYTISPEALAAVDCVDRSKPSALPAGYSLPDVALPPPMAAVVRQDTLIGLCVPKMGMHALLTSEMESAGPFRGSIVLGYDRGQPIFFEPMLTRDMLLEKRSFELPMAGVAGQPRNFQANYDAERQAYRFVFSGFGSQS